MFLFWPTIFGEKLTSMIVLCEKLRSFLKCTFNGPRQPEVNRYINVDIR